MKSLRIVALLLLVLPCGAFARAQKRPLNPRRRRAVAAPNTPAPQQRRLAGRWSEPIVEAVDLLVETHGTGSAGYDETAPPVAVLAFTEGLIDGDFAELVFWKLVRQADFRVDDDFWNIIPLAYGRQRIRAAYEEYREKPQSAWSSQPEFHAFRKGLLKSYRDVCEKVGRTECRVYLARLFRGYQLDEARVYAEQVWDEEVSREETLDPVPGYPGDPEPLTMRRGIRPVIEMVELARRLREAGFDVWTAALVAQPVLESAVPKLGLDVTRAAGIKQAQFKDRLTGRVLEPIPARAGRIEAVIKRAGRTPVLVVGAMADDEALLSYGSGLRILLDSGDQALLSQAARRRWMVQPAFTKR